MTLSFKSKILFIMVILFFSGCINNTEIKPSGNIEINNYYIIEESGQNYYVFSYKIKSTNTLTIHSTVISLEIKTNKLTYQKSITDDRKIIGGNEINGEFSLKIKADEIVDNKSDIKIINYYFY